MQTFLRGLPCLLLFAMLAGCGPPPPPPLRVATNVWPGYEPLYLARELGYLDPAGIHLVEMGSATAVLHELRNGTIDAAALTLDETLTALAEGVPLAVVLVMDVSAGADALVARPEIHTLEELKGRRIGVEDGAVGALMLESALQQAGLDLEQVEPVRLTVDEHLEAWQGGQVDAVVTFEPTRSRLLAAGARVLFDSRQIPGRIIDVLVVRRDHVAGHEEQLRRLLAAYFRAIDFQHRQPRRAASLMQPRLRLPEEEILAAFGGLEQPDLAANRRLLGGELERKAAGLARFMYRHRLLPAPAPERPLTNPRFLPADP